MIRIQQICGDDKGAVNFFQFDIVAMNRRSVGTGIDFNIEVLYSQQWKICLIPAANYAFFSFRFQARLR